MAGLSENMLTVIMLLSVVFLPGVLAVCPNPILSIEGPLMIEALSGSCLHIPCSFSSTDSSYDNTRAIYGIWFRNSTQLNANPSPVIFNSSGSVNTYSLNMIRNLTNNNCTTLFPDVKTNYTDKYFLRIQNWPFRATAVCQPFQITVKDSPWSPSIIIPSDLKEHQSVTITCSALTPCPHSPPELTWNLQQDSHRHAEKNTDGTFTTKIQETITLSDTHDGYIIRCSATYPVNGGNKTAEREVTLSVSYAPKDTSASISPSGLVSAGSWVELSCSSRAKPPPSFTWFRNSKHGAINVSVGPVYSFNANEGGEYYCVAINYLDKQRSSVIYLSTEGFEITILHCLAISVGCICFIVLIVVVWWLKFKSSAPQQTQRQTGEDPAVPIRADETEEEIHYGEVNFLQRSPEASSVSGQDGGQQDTVYAQVKVSADSLEDLYEQVKDT